MRRVKFRGKRLDNGEWVHGNLRYGEVRLDSYVPTYITGMNSDTWEIEVDQGTVCKFTGILERSGTEIYEGDVLKCYPMDKIVVKYEFGFNISEEHIYKGYKLCGNIYDNPELRKLS